MGRRQYIIISYMCDNVNILHVFWISGWCPFVFVVSFFDHYAPCTEKLKKSLDLYATPPWVGYRSIFELLPWLILLVFHSQKITSAVNIIVLSARTLGWYQYNAWFSNIYNFQAKCVRTNLLQIRNQYSKKYRLKGKNQKKGAR